MKRQDNMHHDIWYTTGGDILKIQSINEFTEEIWSCNTSTSSKYSTNWAKYLPFCNFCFLICLLEINWYDFNDNMSLSNKDIVKLYYFKQFILNEWLI